MENSNPENKSLETKDNLDPKNAWIFPLVSWAISITTGFFRSNLGAFLNLTFALIQLGLIIAALVIAIKVLANKQKIYSDKDKNHATIGLVIVGITFILIFVAIISR